MNPWTAIAATVLTPVLALSGYAYIYNKTPEWQQARLSDKVGQLYSDCRAEFGREAETNQYICPFYIYAHMSKDEKNRFNQMIKR